MLARFCKAILRSLAFPLHRRERRFLAAIRTETGRIYLRQFRAWAAEHEGAGLGALRVWERAAFGVTMDRAFLTAWQREAGAALADGYADADAPLAPEFFDALAAFHLRRRVDRVAAGAIDAAPAAEGSSTTLDGTLSTPISRRRQSR